ncbi:MAG TPA: ABC transporter permease [Polyangiaceae bacterium]|nr:ABC transporter permease [Polyangiaceae bacterium]
MTLTGIVLRNLRRKPLRLGITIGAVALSLIAYLLLRTVNAGWTRRVDETPGDRVVTRHKISWEQTMPVNYAEVVRSLPGVREAMGGRAIVLKNPREDKVGFETTAVQAGPFVRMHYELVAPEEQKRAFLDDRRGALVSEALVERFGWKLGDRIRLRGALLNSEIELIIDGIYRSTRHGFARRAVWMHWEYLNEMVSPDERDRISVISAQVVDKAAGAEVAMAIDRHFDQDDVQTFSQEDQAANAAFVGMFGAILRSLDTVGLLVLSVILLLVGNTMSMTTRERSHEFGVLRAIGFSSWQATSMVIVEGILIGLMGAVVGVGLAYPLLQSVVSRYFEQALRLAPLDVPLGASLTALVVGSLLGGAAASLPALAIGRLKVVEALRRI